jgi:chloramphenicol 3-O phosphotransferase
MERSVLPNLLVLNGASSSGKSVTAQALFELSEGEYHLTGFDALLERLQPFGSEHPHGLLGGLERSLRIMAFQLGDGRFKIFQQLHQEVLELLESGKQVILETSLMERRALLDAAQAFAPHGGYFIGMKPPLEISESWEAQRGNRPQGQARKHYEQIHAHGCYDLILDPSKESPENCAKHILTHCAATNPQAFQQLLQNKN